MAGRYKQRDAEPLANLPPDHFMHRTNRIVNKLLIVFLVLTLLFMGSTIVLANTAPHDVNQTVWGRAITEMIIAVAYFFYAYLWRKGKFWGYWRLLSTSGLGVLTAMSITVLPGKYPAWVRLEQVIEGIVVIWLVWTLTRAPVRKHFARKQI